MKRIIYKNKFYNGIWFCGMSGSGKSFSSKYITKKLKKNTIIVDGDDVRKYISIDLDRSVRSRLIQLHRLLGIATIAIKSGLIPIVSGVYMDNNFLNKLKKNNILLVKIERDFKYLKNHKTYKNKKNVVGRDIKYPKFKSIIIYNDSTNFFEKVLNQFVK